MERKPLTLRLPPSEREGLERMSRLLRRPMNQIVTDAVREYLHRGTGEELQIREAIAALDAYRAGGAGLDAAIDAVVESEVRGEDPAEGVIIEVDEEEAPSGPVAGRLRQILRG